MNERLKELAEQAGFESLAGGFHGYEQELESFAELIRLEETKACAKHYLEIMREAVEQAVLKEREACAKLCEDWLVGRDDICEVAKAIRQRETNHD